MPPAKRMTITMPAEMAEILRQSVQSGEYASPSDVIREALRVWQQNRDTEYCAGDTLREAIKTGLNSGPGIPADQVFDEMRARYATKS